MTLPRVIARCFELVLDSFAPSHCPACDSEVLGPIPFCQACREQLGEPVLLPSGGGVEPGIGPIPLRALGSYRPPLSTALRRVKYEQRADLIAPLARAWLGAHAERGPFRADRLVPVPLHPKRLVRRGFNQSALLAAELAPHVRIPVAPRLLAKVEETTAQASLKREQRRTNLQGAFLAQPRRLPAGARLVLIDDVVTTGETARACLRALAKSGFHVVEIWSLGHTPGETAQESELLR